MSQTSSSAGPSDLSQFREDGFVVLDAALDLPRVRALRKAFLGDLGAKVGRFALRPAEPLAEDLQPHLKVLNHFKPAGGNHDFNRWNMHLPSRALYLDAGLVAHPRVLALVHALIGQDAVAYLVASDTPYPGATFQNVHQDFSRFSLALNVPLITFTEENGPLQVWPGSHLSDPSDGGQGLTTDPHKIEPGRMQMLATSLTPRRLLLREGSMVLRDHRLMHRGTANVSNEPRPMLSIYYVSPREVPPRWLADVGAHAAKSLRSFGRGRGEGIQREAIFSLGNVLGRIVEECSLSDRDSRRPIPREIWDVWPKEVRALFRFARVEGNPARPDTPSATCAGISHFGRELWSNARASLVSSWKGKPRDAEPERK